VFWERGADLDELNGDPRRHVVPGFGAYVRLKDFRGFGVSGFGFRISVFGFLFSGLGVGVSGFE